ncbi:MAG TPA: aldo/keto reductase [Microbacteriaceae bacterium]
MSEIPRYALSDGTTLPAIGFGTYPLKGDEGARAVASAIDAGYRLIDTAVNYANEDAVGRGIAASALPREQVQVTTKLPGRDHGYDQTLASFERSCRALGVDYLDLYLIHWPNPSVGKFVDSWRAMIQLQEQGKVRSIGVSNFTPEFLSRLQGETGVLPAVNQVELHPFFPQVELLAFHEQHGIRTEAWSPLGKRAPIREESVIVEAARTHGVTEAQVILRWQVERGVLPIPKTASAQRQRENIDVFGFQLSADEVAAITALGREAGRLFGGDPNTHEEM